MPPTIKKTLWKRPADTTMERPSLWHAIPYIANILEAVACLLKPYGIGVVHRPAETLRSRLMRIKDRVDPSKQSSIIYRAQCKDCSSYYTGQTSRKLATRSKKHRSAIRNCNIKAWIRAATLILPKRKFSATQVAGRQGFLLKGTH